MINYILIIILLIILIWYVRQHMLSKREVIVAGYPFRDCPEGSYYDPLQDTCLNQEGRVVSAPSTIYKRSRLTV